MAVDVLPSFLVYINPASRTLGNGIIMDVSHRIATRMK